jgi:3',5'-nucleoside bisphosphate phosphatase
MNRYAFVIFFLMGFCVALPAQDINNTPVPELIRPMYRSDIRVPSIPGYVTLKCDFHMHTVFSDGIVWPQIRVQEAWLNGLDVVAITDHIRKDGSKERLPGDNNQPYEFAIGRARELNMILVKAGELTKKMPPGHFNALFLKDVEVLNNDDPYAAMEGAAKQGAFIQWNHPGWKSQQPDTTKWWPEHQMIYDKGWMHGIEVFNHTEWYPIALDWCLSKNLTVLADTDLHGATSLQYDLEKWPRPMTLVFSKERSEEGVREALFSHRTVAWFGTNLAGKAEYLEALFRASVQILSAHYTNEKGTRYHELVNTSDLPWKMKDLSGAMKGEVWIPKRGSAVVEVKKDTKELSLLLTNTYISSKEHLKVGWMF